MVNGIWVHTQNLVQKIMDSITTMELLVLRLYMLLLEKKNIVESKHTWDFADFITWQVSQYYTLENGKIQFPKNQNILLIYLQKKLLVT